MGTYPLCIDRLNIHKWENHEAIYRAVITEFIQTNQEKLQYLRK